MFDRECKAALEEKYKKVGSYRKLGRMLITPARPQGYSGTSICQLLKDKYPGGTAIIEDAIRMNLMNKKIDCPELGAIQPDVCKKWQGRSQTPGRNPQSIRMSFACRTCPNLKGGKNA